MFLYLKLLIPTSELFDKLDKQGNITVISVNDKDSHNSIHSCSGVIQGLVDEIARHYALTIYNSSFFLESFDLSLLAQKTDGIVMVVKLQQTPLSQIKEAIARIQNYDLNFLGFVVMAETKVTLHKSG